MADRVEIEWMIARRPPRDRERYFVNANMMYAIAIVVSIAAYCGAYACLVNPTTMWVSDDCRVLRVREPNYRVLRRFSELAFAPAYFADFMLRSNYWLESDLDRLLAEDNEHRSYLIMIDYVCKLGGDASWTTELISVDLNGQNVTDDHLRIFAGIESLNYIDLRGTRVTDSGLEYLTKLRGLQYVNVLGTAVTSQGADKLESAIPGLVISDRKGSLWTKITNACTRVRESGGLEVENRSRVPGDA